MPRWLTHGPTLSRPPASRHWWVQPRQQSGVTCHAWANASRSTVAAASPRPREIDGRRAKAYTTGRTQRCPTVKWKPADRFSERASRSVPEQGAPMTKTGWRTFRPLTTRMCGRGDWEAAGGTGETPPGPGWYSPGPAADRGIAVMAPPNPRGPDLPWPTRGSAPPRARRG